MLDLANLASMMNACSEMKAEGQKLYTDGQYAEALEKYTQGSRLCSRFEAPNRDDQQQLDDIGLAMHKNLAAAAIKLEKVPSFLQQLPHCRRN